MELEVNESCGYLFSFFLNIFSVVGGHNVFVFIYLFLCGVEDQTQFPPVLGEHFTTALSGFVLNQVFWDN